MTDRKPAIVSVARPILCRVLASRCISHYDVEMRTTLDLPDDLHDLLSAVAHDQRRTLSQTASSLLRKALIADDAAPRIDRDPRSGMPVYHVGRIVTSEDVRSLDDGS
jgi:hypothetical protein